MGQRRTRASVDFEDSRSFSEGIILVKFWMHISDDEQLRTGSTPAAADPLKRWKLTHEDWRNRDKNRLYRRCCGGHVRQDLAQACRRGR